MCVMHSSFLPMIILGAAIMPIETFTLNGQVTVGRTPIIGALIFGIDASILFQALFNYLGASFPRDLASTFAGNDLFCSVIAGSFQLFGWASFQ